MARSSNHKSPLKWAGGKFKLLDEIYQYIPNASWNFVDAFAGSAVVGCNAPVCGTIQLNDINEDLCNFYRCVGTFNGGFIKQAKQYFDVKYASQDAYLQLRKVFNGEIRTSRKRAALFLYLNKFGYNGMCRYNSKGGFNIPVGSIAKQGKVPGFPEKELISMSDTLKRHQVSYTHRDFKDVLSATGQGDYVYCDPPYWPLNPTSSFTAYAPGDFNKEDQEDLAKYAKEAASRGAIVVVSNHDVPDVRTLYAGAEFKSLAVQRSIAAKGSARGKAPELIAVFQ